MSVRKIGLGIQEEVESLIKGAGEAQVKNIGVEVIGSAPSPMIPFIGQMAMKSIRPLLDLDVDYPGGHLTIFSLNSASYDT